MTLVSLPTSPPPPAGFTVHCTPRRCRKKTRSNVFASPSHPGTRSVNSKLVTPQTAALDQSTRGSPKAQSSPRSEGQTPSTYPPGRSVKGKPMLPVTGPTDRKTPFDPIRNRSGVRGVSGRSVSERRVSGWTIRQIVHGEKLQDRLRVKGHSIESSVRFLDSDPRI